VTKKITERKQTFFFQEQTYFRNQMVISRRITRESYVTITGNNNATPEDGCALSTLSDLLCYVREFHVQNCLYGNGWKQKENVVDTCIHASNVMNYLRKKLYRRSGDFSFQ
jgi:hypothetical protein